MIPQPPFSPDDGFDDLDLGPGPYDDPALSEENDDRKVDPASPLSRDAPGWIAKSADSGQWRAAQGTWAEEMAEVAGKVGQLKERLRSGPAGGRRRLALMEVADLGWWAGERVGLDQLILAAEDRLAGVQDQSQAFSALLWSVRRLLQPLGPGKDVTGIAAFLGRSRAGEAPGKDLRGIEAALAGAAGVHPIVRGAMVFHLWRASGTGGVTRDLEAAVLGARIAGDRGGVAEFLPLALSSGAGLRASGTVEARLQAWLGGAGQATGAALLHLDRLEDWRARARDALAGLSGKTPGRLVEVLGDLPVVSAPMAEKKTGASRAAVQRNLEMMEEKGLIREMTGQGRYRLWTAKI